MAKDVLSRSHWKAFASRRRDPETKREAVLQTAAQLFLEKSYSRTSLNDVAERLNITRILTLDQRDFQIIRPKHSEYFEILPSSG